MTIREWYKEAIIGKHYYLQLLIEFLIYEKNVLKFEDTTEKLTYYLQDKFHKKINEYVLKYEEERNGANRKSV